MKEVKKWILRKLGVTWVFEDLPIDMQIEFLKRKGVEQLDRQAFSIFNAGFHGLKPFTKEQVDKMIGDSPEVKPGE